MAAEFLSWHHVPGRGWIAEFVSTRPEHDLALFKIGASVEIDGDEYLCTGVETAHGMTLRPKIGVLIRGAPKTLDSKPK
jgi:hypothetical protein